MSLKKLWRTERGTASVEVVIMLPFFFIVYLGVIYIHGLYSGRQIAGTRARACVWEHARNGCPGDRQPPGCDPEGRGARVQSDEVLGETASNILSAVSSLPLMPDLEGALESVLGTPVTATASESKTMPYFGAPEQIRAAPGEGTYTMSASVSTMCNAQPRSWSQVARDTFCTVVGNSFPGC